MSSLKKITSPSLDEALLNRLPKEQQAGYIARMNRKAKRIVAQLKRAKADNRIDERVQKFKDIGESVTKISTAYVYILGNDQYPNWYKVGTCVNLEKRLQTYQTSDPLRQFHYKDTFITHQRFWTEREILNSLPQELFEVKNEWVNTNNYALLKRLLMRTIREANKQNV